MISVTFIIVCLQIFVLYAREPSLPQEPLLIRESKSVTLNNAKFVIVAETEWRPDKSQRENPVEIQLRITNLRKNETVFKTFCTFGIRLIDEAGRKFMPEGGNDRTIFTRPVSLRLDSSYTISRKATVLWNDDLKSCKFIYRDGTGTTAIYGPLLPGKYKLSFWYSVPATDAVNVWHGEAVSDPVVITVSGR